MSKPRRPRKSINIKEGTNGDISFRQIDNVGTVQYLKQNGDWTPMSSSGSMPLSRSISNSSSTGSGITDHSQLSSLGVDDHSQYVLVNGIRAFSGNWTNAGITVADLGTITTVDINGGTVDGISSLTSSGILDIGSHDFRAATITADGLTSGRIVFAGTNGVLSDDSDLTFSTDTLTATKIGAFTAAGSIDFDNQDMTNVDIDSGAIDGTAIGAALASSGSFTTITASTSIDITGSTGLILENDETITNSTNGTVLINGIVSAGTGSAAGVFQSNGDYDVTLQTGNSTTGVITITDGSNGNIDITPNGTGSAVIPKVDIGGGEIDGTAIGANSASTGAFTTVTASTSVDITGSAGLILQNDETITNAVNGTILLTAATTSLSGDLTVTGNNINFGNNSGIDNTTSGRVSVTDVGLGLHINTPVAFTSAAGMAHGTESSTFDSFALRWKSHTSGSYKGQHIAGGELDYKNNYCMVGHSSETSKYADHATDFALQS